MPSLLLDSSAGTLGGGAGRRRGQDIFQQPLAADGGRSARGVRGDGQHAGLAQQPKAVLIGEFYAPEVASIDTGNSIMARQLLVEKGLIRRQQVEDAVVLFQLRVEKQLRLGDERGTEIVVKPGKLGAIRIEQPYIASLQPVREEILDQRRARARGSANMRETCCSRTAGSCNLPRMARSSRVSSGMLLHKKNDNREASSTSETRYTAPGAAPAGSASMRNRKSGLTSTRSSAERIPSSKVPAARRALVEAEQRLHVVISERNGDKPAAPVVDRIFVAQAVSSAASRGTAHEEKLAAGRVERHLAAHRDRRSATMQWQSSEFALSEARL